MTLVDNWRKILKHAWSIRFIAAAFVFSALEIALPLLDGLLPVSQGFFAIASGIATGAAFVSRLLAQSSLPEKTL